MLFRRRFVLVLVLIFAVFSAAGCWDKKEIENRGYVLGIAIDHTATSNQADRHDFDYAPQAAGKKKYRVTYELPKFRKKGESKSTGEAGESHIVWSGEGESMFAISRDMNTKTYFGLFYEDIQMLVFSESVAREGIGQLLDFFLRDAEMRRRMRLFVTPGQAEEILRAKLQVEEVNSTFISKITRNVDKSPSFVGKAELGAISEAIRAKRPFIMPIVMLEGKDVKLGKGAVFNKDKKMVGELNELEVVGAKILKKQLKQGVTVVTNPASPDKLAAFELYQAKIKVSPHLQDENLSFTVEANFVGNLGEQTEDEQDAMDKAFQSAVEDAVAAEFIREVELAYKKQQQFKTDVCDLGGAIHRQYPQYWEKIKDRWDEEIFPTVPLRVQIKVIIKRPVMMH